MVEDMGGVGAEERANVAPPRVWCLLGQRRGDNQQVLALAEALGEPFVVKRLRYAPASRLSNLLRRRWPLGIEVDAATPIRPPWPELVLSVGKRSVPQALAIRAAAGGRCRLVQLGRPSAPLGWFDLILTVPQYRLPPGPNVIEMPLPFGHAKANRPTDVNREFAALKHPLVAVLVGGPTKELRLGEAEASSLAQLALERAVVAGGTVVVCTSPRTPAAVADALRSLLRPPHRVDVWQPGAPNHYAALLAAADRIVVTADSVSMLSDACSSMAAVEVFALLPQVELRGRIGRWVADRMARHWPQRTLLSRLFSFPAASGLWMPPRDYAAVHEALHRCGLLGARACSPAARHLAIAAWEHVAVERVRLLLPQAS